MARSILEILIQTIKRGTGFEDSQKGLEKLNKSAESVNRTLGLFGLAVGGRELVEFANASREAARTQTDAKNALVGLVGSVQKYQEAVKQVQDATKGTVSETEAARTAFGLLDNGIAKSAEEAAKYALAGKALNSALGETASYEKFLMLLDEGSSMLLNNFNITASAVDARQKLIEANTNLQGSEARLQAVRELALEKGLALANTISEETIATQNAIAAQENFIASFGQVINALDQTMGATGLYTAALNSLTDGAKAWQIILEQQIPAIDAHNKAVDESVGKQIAAAKTADDLRQIQAEGVTDWDTVKAAIIGASDSFEEYEARMLALAQANADANGEFDALLVNLAPVEEEFDAVKEALRQAAADSVVSSGIWVSSVEAMSITSSQVTQSIIEDMDKIAARQAALDAYAPQTNREADAYRQMAMGRVGFQDAALEETNRREQEVADERRATQEAAARQSERIFKQQAQAMVKATSELGTQISSAVSGAISQNSQDVISKLLGIDTADQNAGEAVRRMAAVAAGGIKDQWAPQLAAQLAGVKDQTAQAFVQAFQQGDDAALKAQAQKLALNPIVELFDAGAIANRIEQQLRAQQLQQQLNERVNALLGERGLEAVAGVTQQVGQAVTTTGQAATQVGADLTGVAASAEGAGSQVSKAFEGALPAIDTLNQRFDLMLGKLSEINKAAGLASGNIAGMNPPAVGAGVPSDAQRKMGAPSPL